MYYAKVDSEKEVPQMIDVKISYFYNIRFFEPWQIPLSTAVWDPKWYHEGKGPNHVYVDKRGVVCGLRIHPLMPPKQTEGLCHGSEGCAHTPDSCPFLSTYLDYLHTINFNHFLLLLQHNCYKVCNLYNIAHKPEAIFIVHEKYDNPCSERVAIRKWFEENGMRIPEYVHDA